MYTINTLRPKETRCLLSKPTLKHSFYYAYSDSIGYNLPGTCAKLIEMKLKETKMLEGQLHMHQYLLDNVIDDEESYILRVDDPLTHRC